MVSISSIDLHLSNPIWVLFSLYFSLKQKCNYAVASTINNCWILLYCINNTMDGENLLKINGPFIWSYYTGLQILKRQGPDPCPLLKVGGYLAYVINSREYALFSYIKILNIYIYIFTLNYIFFPKIWVMIGLCSSHKLLAT